MNILNKLKQADLMRAQEFINDYITNIENENNNLKEIIKTYNKDEEISKLTKELQDIRNNSIHINTKKEKEGIQEFSSNHYNKCKSNSEIIVTGSGIGNMIKIRCIKCKDQKDVTDIDNW